MNPTVLLLFEWVKWFANDIWSKWIINGSALEFQVLLMSKTTQINAQFTPYRSKRLLKKMICLSQAIDDVNFLFWSAFQDANAILIVACSRGIWANTAKDWIVQPTGFLHIKYGSDWVGWKLCSLHASGSLHPSRWDKSRHKSALSAFDRLPAWKKSILTHGHTHILILRCTTCI